MSASRAAGIAALAVSVLGAGMASTAVAAPATTALTGSAAPVATGGATGTAVKSGQKLSLQVWLAPDTTGATAFDNAVSTPGSAGYHHYLSPAQYTARFGPSAAEANAVKSWLGSQGLSNVTVSPQRDYVSATGTAAKVGQAFSVQMKRYSVTNTAGKATHVVTNDANLAIPSSLSADVLSVTGLNSTQASTFHTATPATVKAATSATKPQCSQYWAQFVKKITPTVDGITQSPYSVCGYSADQLRDAYGMSTTNSGVGVTVALIEIGVPKDMPQTLADYAATNNLPAPGASQFQEEIIGQGNKCGNEFDIEEQLDSEATYAMAPGANQLMVDGDSCNTQLQGVQPLFDAETAVLNGDGTTPSATIESNSWGLQYGESLYPSIYAETAHAIDLRAAAEGVSMLFSSGDNPGISVPASDPYSTAVGGTTLGLGQGNTRLFETGWSDDNLIKFRGQWLDEGIGRDAAGGGVSLLYSQPSYQAGIVPASMSTTSAGAVDRAVPDISADADADSGILQGIIEVVNHKPVYVTFDDGGTSLASPLVAGVIADASQGQAASFGFINPLLYSLSGTNAYNDPLPLSSSTPVLDQTAFTPASIAGLPVLNPLDAQGAAYDSQTDQVTATGYDTMTGLGTPDGSNFISALRSGS
jgi:subtilase family serine protease